MKRVAAIIKAATVAATILASGCFGAGQAEPKVYEPITIPTDGTWDEAPSDRVAGFGEWSSRKEQAGPTFAFRVDAPPTLTQERNWVTIQSTVHVLRNHDGGLYKLALSSLHASLRPGVSIVSDDEEGPWLRYDETYGEAQVVCADEEIDIGEETTCVLSYTERQHPEWLQNSYWNFHGTSVAIWPSQTVG